MPRVSFSSRDLLRGKIITPDWYRVKIESVGEQPSKDGSSTNYPVEATIIRNAETGDETLAGMPIEWMFNSKAIGFARGFLEALGVSLEADRNYELSQAAGEEIEIFIENDTWQGRTVNRVNHKYRSAKN